MWWVKQKIAAMRVANDRRKTAFRLPSQMDSMVSKASRKSTVIILAKPVFSEQLVLLGWLNGAHQQCTRADPFPLEYLRLSGDWDAWFHKIMIYPAGEHGKKR